MSEVLSARARSGSMRQRTGDRQRSFDVQSGRQQQPGDCRVERAERVFRQHPEPGGGDVDHGEVSIDARHDAHGRP